MAGPTTLPWRTERSGGQTGAEEYIGRVPAAPLDRFIDDSYCLTGVPHHRLMNVPPMPSAHLFLHLDGPFRLWDSDRSVPRCSPTGGSWAYEPGAFSSRYPTRVRSSGCTSNPGGKAATGGKRVTVLTIQAHGRRRSGGRSQL
jgi:hypothetical protein